MLTGAPLQARMCQHAHLRWACGTPLKPSIGRRQVPLCPQVRQEWQHPMMNNAFSVPWMTLVVGGMAARCPASPACQSVPACGGLPVACCCY